MERRRCPGSDEPRTNIANASELAMEKAVHALEVDPDFLLVDAFTLDLDVPQRAIEHGDALSVSIAAASIVAKVHCDEKIAACFSAIFKGEDSAK